MKTAVVLILAIAAQAAGNVYLSKGMKAVAATASINEGDAHWLVLRGIESPMIWIGTALLLAFFILFAASLSWADLSFVLPATSFGYVINVACGHYFLNEAVTPARWAGALLISVGVIFVSRSGARAIDASGERKIFSGEGER